MNFYKALLFIFLISLNIYADDFEYNSYNNHGNIGLINMPTARFYNESAHGITAYNGNPIQKITFTSNPYDWLEASFFYTSIKDKPYCSELNDPVCGQDYKDKGFNFKIRIKEEGLFPAIALGVNDIGGNGLSSSEYVVASYGKKKLDVHFGIGWGALNGAKYKLKNPFIYLDESFKNRSEAIDDFAFAGTGDFQLGRLFSNGKVSPFFGVSYSLNKKLLLKIENDTTMTEGPISYDVPKNRFSFGIDYFINKNLTLGIANERGNYFSLKFIYKNNPNISRRVYDYKKSKDISDTDNKYTKLIKNLEGNGIGVNKIIETADSLGLELTQFIHPNIDIVEQILMSSKADAGIKKDIKTDLKIANLNASSNFIDGFEENSQLIYKKSEKKSFNNKTQIVFKPFLASREEFFKGAILVENNAEFVLADNFFFTSNLKYSIADNFDDLTIPPRDFYPAQVRSDVKNYLRNIDEGVIIGRAQFDYHLSPKKNNHIMITAGILEDMFSGYGFEYLYFNPKINYAYGFEVFNVVKRDYKMRFGSLDYNSMTGSLNFYYRNYGIIPFDAQISYGKYLAGDKGTTFELSRSFMNGVEFGVFATFTDVSSKQFGEGSFDKGIFFNIPIYMNLVNYTWKPLTKDPGAKLNRKHTLHDLLVKFRPHNSKN
jgi:hypothetical protein